MKKIFIFSHAMEIGGAERALLGLLETIDTTKYEVDLFLMRHSGELMKYIPGKIHLLPEIPAYACMAVPLSSVLKKRRFGVAVGRYIGKRKARKRIEELQIQGENDIELEYSHKYTVQYMPWISNTEYDLAISFLTPHYYVANKVNAKKKAAWIHTDYSKVQVDMISQLEMWDQYDSIISISDQVTQSFLSIFPSLTSKISLIENIMPVNSLNDWLMEFSPTDEMPEDGSFRLLSIGRFTKAKNFDNIPDICRRILEKGIDVKWYLIGYGGDENLIRQKIAYANMEDRVIILGKKENPYPYINACDIYVQPSRYEGKCVAVREAQMLHKPVVITDYTTSSSQLKNGYDGIIVPMDNERCAEAIVSVIRDPFVCKEISANTKENDYSNSSEIEKIYWLVEGQ